MAPAGQAPAAQAPGEEAGLLTQMVRGYLAYTVANATAGKIRVRLMYTVDRRATENQIS